MSKNTVMRLQKFLSQAGVASRRAAEEIILNGVVSVNGVPATLGQSVDSEVDEVRVSGDRVCLPTEKRVVLLLNKPRGFLCSNKDPHHARTVFDLLPPEFVRRKLFCVGRLDKDSEGMLLLTDDGDVGNRIMHPSGGVVKRYQVTVNRPFDPTLIPNLLKGAKVPVESYEPADAPRRPARKADELLRFKRVIWEPRAPTTLEIHLDQGRKREIRRLLEVFGFFVKTLFRYQIGGLIMSRMPPGDCRKLTQKEIARIFPKDKVGG
ncbi:MAG: rRNA pseudouridine synthase [Puniceicoccales bacterium]|jgi:23S rRNA pseudouridine2605 synthase|nr:rRNA pseudouridine synthase [Puniceicoccales bacterium]